MTAYDAHDWVEFGVALAGAAAVLTGLVFVSVSINLEKVLEVHGLPGRAGESIVMFAGVLILSVCLLLPGQSRVALGVELVVGGALLAALLVLIALPGLNRPRPLVIRKLSDDTLLVFLSDCHIGGDEGRDIFESPEDLAALFDSLDSHSGPVALVLAGDFFDFLRLAEVPTGENRASATMSRPEYGELFAALRRFATGQNRTVVYMPGNHDAEAWWNPEIRTELEDAGLVHEFALSYAASFESEADRVVYREHGNEFDPTNTIRDYGNPLDTPLGSHVVTDILPRLPIGWAFGGGSLRDVHRVFPLPTIGEWLAVRLYYAVITQMVRWLLLPLLILYAAHALIEGGGSVDVLLDLGYAVGVLLVVFGLFLLIAGRSVNRSVGHATARVERTDEPALIRSRLETGRPLPLGASLDGEIGLFVSGHTHAPALTHFDGPAGKRGAIVNSGCWLRQLQPVAAHLGAPPVFISRFVQTHVRVYSSRGAIQVELWEHPRPSPQRMRLVERLALAGRLPAEPEEDAPPRVRARTSVERTSPELSDARSGARP